MVQTSWQHGRIVVCHKVANLRNSLSCLTDLSPQNMLIISNTSVKFTMRFRRTMVDDDDDFLGESVKERKRVLNVGAVAEVPPGAHKGPSALLR